MKIPLDYHPIFLVDFVRECTMYLRLEYLYLTVGSIVMHDLSGKYLFYLKRIDFMSVQSNTKYVIC